MGLLSFFRKSKNVSVIPLQGIIAANMGRRKGLSLYELDKSIEQAFAKSVLFGFKIVEKRDENYIIDLTPFLMQDTHGVSERLKSRREGTYKIDASKSALALERKKHSLRMLSLKLC